MVAAGVDRVLFGQAGVDVAEIDAGIGGDEDELFRVIATLFIKFESLPFVFDPAGFDVVLVRAKDDHDLGVANGFEDMRFPTRLAAGEVAVIEDAQGLAAGEFADFIRIVHEGVEGVTRPLGFFRESFPIDAFALIGNEDVVFVFDDLLLFEHLQTDFVDFVREGFVLAV